MASGVYKHHPHQGFQKGHKPFHDGAKLKGRCVSPSTLFKKGHTLTLGISKSPEARRRMSEAKKHNPNRYWLGKQRHNMRGNHNPMWVANPKTDESKLARKEVRYREWRKTVYERDDYTCQSCGTRGGQLHPDHVMPFSAFPDLRYELLNGRTLCVPCHKRTDTYGKKASSSPLALSK